MITIADFNRIYETEQSFVSNLFSEPDEETEAEFEKQGTSQDAFLEMIESGIYYWSHPGWVNCLDEALRSWGQHGQLIKARLFAESILPSLPEGLYSHIREKLQAIAGGNFCLAYDGYFSIYPRQTEYYLSSLDWTVVERAIDARHWWEITARAARLAVS